MLITVGQLRHRVQEDLRGLLTDLAGSSGRAHSAEEEHAWAASLPRFADALSTPSLQGLHLYFKETGQLSLEYPLPAASYWCDAVLLGKGDEGPSAVIIEMKDWVTRGDRPGRAQGLIERQGAQWLHPSDQVNGYVEYCRRFHSAILDHDASVAGCVLFTRDYVTEPYTSEPNVDLAAEYPVFTMAANDLNVRLPAFLSSRISEPDEEFARDFEGGRYRQDRGFLAQIGKQILDPGSSHFELLDDQRRAFALCAASARDVVRSYEKGKVQKTLIVVKGPPGSGKSAVAARLWASLVCDPMVPEGQVVFTTTSSSQTTNWESLFDDIAGIPVGRGIVQKANSYYPVSTHKLGVLRKRFGKDFLSNPQAWRANLQTLRDLGEPFQDGATDNRNLIAIVDEAHALINPERPEGRGQFGFVATLGPQAYQILRCSFLTVMFLDPEQGFRERENTRIAELREWARELNVGDVIELDLGGAQFRCAGSAEYVEWLEGLLRGDPATRNSVRAGAWRVDLEHEVDVIALQHLAQPRRTYSIEPADKPANSPRYRLPFKFHLADTPHAMEDWLRQRAKEGKTVRILSSFSREWKTRSAANPHGLPPELQDFHIEYPSANGTGRWSRNWNHVPQGDYTWFIQARQGSKISADPLCEVGCPYVVRGFDYDYAGILWLDDLIWRGDRWHLNLDSVHETGLANMKHRAMRERAAGGEGPACLELRRRTSQAYRILFTRALEGICVWIQDPETRRHVSTSLGD